MKISELINILANINELYGDLEVNIFYDPRQSESPIKDPEGINIDKIKTVQVQNNGTINIMNVYSWVSEYKNCRGEVFYNPNNKLFEGNIFPNELIDGYDLSFSTIDKFGIEEVFREAVDKYYTYLNNIKIAKTVEVVDNILNNQSSKKEEEV